MVKYLVLCIYLASGHKHLAVAYYGIYAAAACRIYKIAYEIDVRDEFGSVLVDEHDVCKFPFGNLSCIELESLGSVDRGDIHKFVEGH